MSAHQKSAVINAATSSGGGRKPSPNFVNTIAPILGNLLPAIAVVLYLYAIVPQLAAERHSRGAVILGGGFASPTGIGYGELHKKIRFDMLNAPVLGKTSKSLERDRLWAAWFLGL